jgi:murein peptide amidase A
VLRGLILALLVALGAAADSERRFENDVHGHSVLVPPGWSAQLSESGTTNVLSYRSGRLDRLGSPPRGQVRVIVAGYGPAHCRPEASHESAPKSLGRRVSFEGFPDGYSVGFCLRGHSFQALVPVGRGASAKLIEQARQVVASVRLTPRAREVGNARSVRQLGRSVEGRPLRAWRIGNPKAMRRELVVGCIHGDECAGLAVTQRLVNLARPIDFDLWIVQQLNPDGLARGTRGNAHGVDLNRDFLAATQRETRIARKLILRLRPDVTIWFHQPQSVVRAWGLSRATARRYARLAGVPYRSLAWPAGSASRWQNGLGQVSFVVELPPGELPDPLARRHAAAVIGLAD